MSNLIVDSILKNYGEKQLLTDVFLSCSRGEIIGLLGRNGAGKSTLLKIIFGTESAEGRFVKVGDSILNGIDLMNPIIKYLPQESLLPRHLKVAQCIKLFCHPEQQEKVFNLPFISPLLMNKCRDLSGGESRLLEVILLIFSNAQFILLDEPFNGISPLYKEEIIKLIKQQSNKKGFILTDHDYRSILQIATKVVLLHQGATKEIKQKTDLIKWGYFPESFI